MSCIKKQTTSSAARKPYCKVCHDAGKTEQDYTNHFVRSKDGATVTCPTLLAQCCKKCNKKGHTASYCKAVPYVYKKPVEKKQEEEKKTNIQSLNRFAVAFDSDDEDEDENNDFPALCANATSVSTHETYSSGILGSSQYQTMSYSAAAAGALAVHQAQKFALVTPMVTITRKYPIGTSWADMDDSDSDCDNDCDVNCNSDCDSDSDI